VLGRARLHALTSGPDAHLPDSGRSKGLSDAPAEDLNLGI